jgi:hypothetical protein
MSWKKLAVSTAVLLAVAGGSQAGADDILRLGGKGDAATLTLGSKGEADNLLVRGWHGGGYHPAVRYGYRGYHHYGAFRYGGYHYYGAHRYWYPRYYRPYYGGYYWPWRAVAFGLSFWPGYYSYYYNPPVIYSPPVYPYTYPAEISVSPVPSTTILSTPRTLPAAPPLEVAPPPAVRPSPDGTYPYDGGPQNPVPLPKKVEPAPTAVPPAPVVPGGRVVSLPRSSGEYAYLGYGEKPPESSPQMTQITRMKK